MSRTVDDVLAAAEKIDLNYQVSLSLIEGSEQYVRLQQDQLMHGLTSQETKIGKYKNESYARRKNEMNSLPGYGQVDLKYTGAFQESIFVQVEGDTSFVYSADGKTTKLVENYGERIFGLGPSRQDKFNPIVQQILVEDMIKELSK